MAHQEKFESHLQVRRPEIDIIEKLLKLKVIWFYDNICKEKIVAYKEYVYTEFCKVFCTHDWYAYGVLKKHSKIVRKSTIAENGTVCNDTILKLK